MKYIVPDFIDQIREKQAHVVEQENRTRRKRGWSPLCSFDTQEEARAFIIERARVAESASEKQWKKDLARLRKCEEKFGNVLKMSDEGVPF